jgi:predicted aspartyl protease
MLLHRLLCLPTICQSGLAILFYLGDIKVQQITCPDLAAGSIVQVQTDKHRMYLKGPSGEVFELSWQGIMSARQCEWRRQEWQPGITALIRPHLYKHILLALVMVTARSAAQDVIAVRVVNGVVLAPVQVEGRSLSFLIDTGSTASSIDPVTAHELGLTPSGKARVLKNFRDIVADVVEIASVRIGSSTFTKVKFTELNLAPIAGAVGAQVDGVLGNDILEKSAFKLNYSKQLLLMGGLNRLGATGSAIPLLRKDGQFLISARLVSESSDLVLDTGTNLTNLSWRTWDRLTSTWKPLNVVEGIVRAGNPTSPAILVCLPEIRLGAAILRNQAVRAQARSGEGTFSSEDFGGILGSDILRQFEVTFDLEHNRVFLRRDASYKREPYRFVTIGIQIGKNAQGSYEIKAVWRHSPASQAGVQEGDVLVAVNGEAVDTLRPEEVSKRLHAKEGTVIALTTERNTRRSTVTLRTRELLCGR